MRNLSEKFRTDLKKGGMLFPILKAVNENKDFILCIREDKIDIYYRGGCIFNLEYKNKKYIVGDFDIAYALENKGKIKKINNWFSNKIITEKKDAARWVKYIGFLKPMMDYYFSNAKKETMEKYVQQLIVQENNLFNSSNDTDFFIVDFEYQTEGKDAARFDLVGLYWDRKTRSRPKNCKLAVIEVKYGYGSLTGDSGLSAHLKKTDLFLSDKKRSESFKKEMLEMFKQERELKLFNLKAKQPVTEVDPEIDFIIILAGCNPGSGELISELEKMETETGKLKVLKQSNIKFAVSSFAGYSVFKENIKSFSEFRDCLKRK